MFIVNADRDMVINLESSVSIECDGKRIYARMVTEESLILGTYKDNGRAKVVFDEMVDVLFSDGEPLTVDAPERPDELPFEDHVMWMNSDAKAEVCFGMNTTYYMPEE